MLFAEDRLQPKVPMRPDLPAGFTIDYEIGFLFNFSSSKSTRFDLEPLLVYNKGKTPEYKRISLQAEKGLAFLQPLEDSFYTDLLQFSDANLIYWMSSTGNRFIRNVSTGGWAHASTRELLNLRKHYIHLLHKLWPTLRASSHVFILTNGRFNNNSLQPLSLGKETADIQFSADRERDKIILKTHLFLNGQESKINLMGGFLLERNNTLYLPPGGDILPMLETFKKGAVSFPLSEKKAVITKYLEPRLDRYKITFGDKLNVEMTSPSVQSRVRLSELNESNLMIRAEFIYEEEVIEYDDDARLVVEQNEKIKIIQRNKEEEKKLYEYLRTLHPSFAKQNNNLFYYLPFAEVMKGGWFITMMRKVQE